MSPIFTKHEFRAPSDIIEAERERLGIMTPPAGLALSALPLVGTWINCDHRTRGLIRLMISASGPEITVHAFGACQPTPCDWGVVAGTIYAENVTTAPASAFTAAYNFGFKETIVAGHLFNGSLLVETFDHFTDKSGRADYYSQYVMSS